jgi:hypothetical protein
VTENNQFLDPPIAPQYRTDEPPQSEDNDNQQSLIEDDLDQNEGYRSICRE